MSGCIARIWPHSCLCWDIVRRWANRYRYFLRISLFELDR